jgi:hypothetical protein
MSNHHYVTVAISGTNAAAAANAVKEQAEKREDLHLQERKDALVLVGAYSGIKPITLIAELSEQFPTEQSNLNIGAGYGGGTFQGTMTIQNGQFFDVTDEEDPNRVEWEDLVIRKTSPQIAAYLKPDVAVYRVIPIGLLGKSKKVTVGESAKQCEHLITTFTKTAEGEEMERCACGMVAIEQEDGTWKEVC